MPPNRLRVSLTAVTPLFIGGADHKGPAEFRPSSLKGQLRYWFRAVDAVFRKSEERFFGSTTSGQSPCLLRLDTSSGGVMRWEYERYRRPAGQGGYKRGMAYDAPNGINYLGYTLTLGDNRERKAIPPNSQITVHILPRPRAETVDLRRAWITSLWLLCHVGGLGTRSRRGLGSVRIEEWGGWPECAELPLGCMAQSAGEWHERMARGIDVVHAWFARPEEVTHAVLARGARMLLLKRAHQDWEAAIDDAGYRLQTFRQRREPDYSDVKAHLSAAVHVRTSGTAPAWLRTGPERAGFGLPLSFQYSSLSSDSRPVRTQFRGTQHDRVASPLFVRVVRLRDGFHGAFAYVPSPLLAPNEMVTEIRQSARPLPMPPRARTVVLSFLDEAVMPDAVEVAL